MSSRAFLLVAAFSRREVIRLGTRLEEDGGRLARGAVVELRENHEKEDEESAERAKDAEVLSQDQTQCD